MGIQSFDDSDLVFLRRRHTAHAAMEAVDNCLCAGYENISIDLIYGLPGQTVERWTNNLRQAVTLNVPHISAYNLIYEEGTALWRMREKGLVKECEEEESLQMFETLIDVLVFLDMSITRFPISPALGVMHFIIHLIGKVYRIWV